MIWCYVRLRAAYADMIPAQEVFDRYYAEMSNMNKSKETVFLIPSSLIGSDWLLIFDALFSPDKALCDVGCANGALLAEFKKRGYAKLIGFDPSPTVLPPPGACTELLLIPRRLSTQ